MGYGITPSVPDIFKSFRRVVAQLLPV
uniref:LysR family transcriptional regulator n=1 Tax=Heterorhabditis bacteriophora TaxID=37862 RepID=A0A1I7WKY2_HETBA